MKKFLKYAVLTFFAGISLYLSSATAQSWRSLNGPTPSQPYHRHDYEISVRDDTLYAVPDEGYIFKRALNSSQWIEAGSGTRSHKAFGIGENGNYYIFDYEVVSPTEPPFSIQDYSWSADYGRTWSEPIESSDMEIEDIFFADTYGVLLGGNGVYRLAENNNSFHTLDSTLSVRTFYQHSDTLIAGGYGGLAISENQGYTWQKIGSDTLRVRSVISFNDHLFIGTDDQGLIQQKLGADGTFVSGIPKININAFAAFENALFAATAQGIYSVNPETMQAALVFPALKEHTIYSLAAYKDTLYVGTRFGLYHCSVTDQVCEPDNPPTSTVYTVKNWMSDKLLVSQEFGYSGFDIKQNRWSYGAGVGRPEFIHPKTDTSFFVGSYVYLYTFSFNTDSALAMVQIESDNRFQGISENEDGVLFVYSYRNVFKSEDRGSSWEKIYSIPNPIPREDYIYSIFTYGDSLLFINSSRGFIRHNIFKGSFSTIDFEGRGKAYPAVSENGVLFVGSGSELYKSSDAGKSWTKILSDKFIDGVHGFLRKVLYDDNSEKIYLMFRRGVLYVSKDEGENWGVNDDLFPMELEDATLGEHGAIYLASSRAGVFTNHRPIDPPVTISNEDRNSTLLPSAFILHQNYPNPFNPATTVPFNMAQGANLQVTVYNVYGRKVLTYDLGYYRAGFHNIYISLQQQASGVYFLRMKAGKQSQTIKMSLIK